jgi:hypothetical protein
MDLTGLILLIAAVLLVLFILRRRCNSEGYAGQTPSSRAGGIAGPSPNYPNYVASHVLQPATLLIPEDQREEFEHTPAGCPFGCPADCSYGCSAGFGCPFNCPAKNYIPEPEKENCCGGY